MPNRNNMIRRIVLFLVLILCNSKSVFSQDKQIRHTIAKGETITKIAKEYNVTAADIYKINTEANKVLKLNSVLLIPVVSSKKVADEVNATKNFTAIIHEVLPKETLYSISKQYGVTINEINQCNSVLESQGLQIGQKIIVLVKPSLKSDLTIATLPKKETPVVQSIVDVQLKSLPLTEKPVVKHISTEKETQVSIPQENEMIIHEVLPKETKYSLAKKYGISVAELERLNPEVFKSLPVGFKLNLGKCNSIKENRIVVGSSSQTVDNEKAYARGFCNSDLAEQLVINASENLGTRYYSGGTSKSGFDCSGLICTTFEAFNIKLPRSSFELASYGTKIGSEEAQKGDLIFFKTNGRNQINHVGMVVEVCEGEIRFIHASQRGVIISSTKENYYKNNFIQINRVL